MEIPYEDDGECISIIWGTETRRYQKIYELWNSGKRYLLYTDGGKDCDGKEKIYASQSFEDHCGKKFLLPIEAISWQHMQSVIKEYRKM